MRIKREKVFQIIIASLTSLVLSYILFLTTNTHAKENPPGFGIKQIVQNYQQERKEKLQNTDSFKQEIQEFKDEVISDTQAAKTELQSTTPALQKVVPTFTVTPFPTQKPIPTVHIAPPNPPVTPNLDRCTTSGGFWAEFPNSCGDSCSLVKNKDLMCAQVITSACDCGVNMCWNGDSCVNNPSVLGISNDPTPTPTVTVTPHDPEQPACGNGICEAGEFGTYHCPICKQGVEPCPYNACFHKPGSCPQDCLLQNDRTI